MTTQNRFVFIVRFVPSEDIKDSFDVYVNETVVGHSRSMSGIAYIASNSVQETMKAAFEIALGKEKQT